VSFREYLSRFRDHWIVFVAIVAAVVGAVWLYSGAQTPEYSAQSTVLVSAQAGTTVQELQQGTNFTQGRVTTYKTLVETPLVLKKVIAELGLLMTPDELAEHIEATSPELTTLIEIAVTYSDAEVAAAIANSAANSLILTVDEVESPVLLADGTAGVDPAISPVRVAVVEGASVPEGPSAPDWRMNTLLALVMGIVLAVTVVALLSTINTRIRGVRDVRRITNAPILGRIAHGSRSDQLPIVNNSSGPRAESFRTLRTNIQSLAYSTSNSLAVTSSTSSELRTVTTVNLAIALTEAGARVLVVDANLRDPKVAELLDVHPAVGLTDVLLGQVPLEAAVARWEETDLSVLPAGRSVANPSELLGSARMVALIDDLESKFDFVLLDTPALLPVTDAAVVAKRVGSAILVATAGVTKRGQLAEAMESLEQANATVAGIVLMLPRRPSTVDNDATQYEFVPVDDSTIAAPRDVRATRQPG